MICPYDEKYKIYNDKLSYITGIKFSYREIDVVSCFLNNRNTKKISSLLNISSKTVGTHINNIRLKLGCYSREAVIDFFEKSEIYIDLKKYYYCILVSNSFERLLNKIKSINKSTVQCCTSYNYDFNDQDNDYKVQKFKDYLESTFSKIGITITEKKIAQYHLVVNFSNQSKILKNIVLFSSEENKLESYNVPENIDISSNIYLGIFLLLKHILGDKKINELIEDFNNECKNYYLHALYQSDNDLIKQPIIHTSKLGRYKIYSVFFFITIFITSISSLFYLNKNNREFTQIRSDLILPVESILLTRSDIISRIEKGFKEKSAIKVIALVGIGGSGKTTIARQFARQEKSNIIWEFAAETEESLEKSFNKFAYEIAKTKEDQSLLKEIINRSNAAERKERIINFVKEKLRINSKWFLIYDNVKHFTIIQKYMPMDSDTWGTGKILITTQDNNIQNNNYVNDTIKVGELNSNQKLSFFKKILNNKKIDDEIIQNFLSHIPPFPLDISVASHYLTATNTSFDKYLEILYTNNIGIENVKIDLLKELGTYGNTRYNIITSAIQNIIKSDKKFEDIFLFISLIDSQNIPKSLLEKYKNRAVIDSFIFNLKKFSLINDEFLSSLGLTFSIHRSTQSIMLGYLYQKLNLKKDMQLIYLISDALEDYINNLLDIEDTIKIRQLLSNYEIFLGHNNLLNESIRGTIESVLGGAYSYLGYYDLNKVTVLLEKSLINLNKSQYRNRLRIAFTLGYLGINYKHIGNLKKAVELLEQSIATYKQTNQNNNPRITRNMVHLGNIYRILGDYKKSTYLLEKSVTIYQKYSENHLGLGTAMRYLGVLYRDTGDFQKSINVLEKSSKIFKKAKEYIGSAEVTVNLGNIYRELGNYQNAKELLESSLSFYKNNLPQNHINIGWSLGHLAAVYNELGDYQKAKSLLEQGLAIYKNHYGNNDSINIAWILVNLGNSYIGIEDYPRAKALFEEGLTIHQRYLSKGHIDIGWNLLQLGVSYQKLGDYQKARDLLKQCMIIYSNHYTGNSIQIARVLSTLGNTYFLEGENLKEAEILLYKALKIFQSGNHPEIYITLENLSDLYLKKALYEKKSNFEQYQKFKEKATGYLKQALEVINKNFLKTSVHRKRISTKLKDIQDI